MEYQVKIKPKARKELNKIPKNDYYRILSALAVLASNPFIGKKMKGDYKNYYTHRVWPYRIIFQIVKKQLLVFIVRIGQRKNVYK